MIITKQMVNDFCQMTGDFNKIHLDEEYAKTTKFGRCIVPGTLVNGLIGAEIARQYPGCILTDLSCEYLFPCFVDDNVIVLLSNVWAENRRKRLDILVLTSSKIIKGSARIYEAP